jgi:cell division protein FtsQ
VALFEERRRSRRRRRLVQVALALVLVAAVAVTGWAVWFSSWFAVTQVQVVGAHRLSAAQVEAAARVPMGTPMLRLDTAPARRRVAALTDVASVVVTTEWPHTVRITVVERAPVAVVRELGGAYRLVDRDGVDLGSLASRPQGLPLLSLDLASTDPPTLAAAATVAASLPAKLVAKVRWISADTANSVVLQLTSGAVVRWGDATQDGIKSEVLLALLKRAANVYDVSAPYAPTTARN